jgi:uncharacterized membrane protein
MEQASCFNWTCPVCEKEVKSESVVHPALIHSALRDEIAKAHPRWRQSGVICSACLTEYRAKYIRELLEDEKEKLADLSRGVLRNYDTSEFGATLAPPREPEMKLGDRLADRLAVLGGSWGFIIIFVASITLWMTINSAFILNKPLDPFPYILLNLLLSCLAAIQAPIIMMSQNRQATLDRMRAAGDYRVNLRAAIEIRQLNNKIDQLLTSQWERLMEIQRVQTEILSGLEPKPEQPQIASGSQLNGSRP